MASSTALLAPAPIEPAPEHTQTGPRTAAGKAKSSVNATLHGGTSKKLIVPGEIQSDFDAPLSGLQDEYRPDTPQSQLFVETLATAHWFLWRRQRASNAIETAVYANEPNEANWTDEHVKRLALADRYKTQAERALNRALRNLENWRKNNRSEADRERRQSRWAASHDLRVRRLRLQEEKFAGTQSRREATAEAKAFRFVKTAATPQAKGEVTAPKEHFNLHSVANTPAK